MKSLKKEMNEGVKIIKNHFDKQVQELKDTLKNPGTTESAYEYFTIMKKNIDDSIKRYSEFSYKYKKYIEEIQNVYNKVKKGRHPIPENRDPLNEVFVKIGKELEITSLSKIKLPDREQFKTSDGKNIVCELRSVSAAAKRPLSASYIIAIDIGKKYVTVEYYFESDKKMTIQMPFTQLCIINKKSKDKDVEDDAQQGGALEENSLFNDESFSGTSIDE
jgi:hypothetical protein